MAGHSGLLYADYVNLPAFPAIHVFAPAICKKDVDARHICAKTRFALLAGHDGE
jgi:hypothetical protein